MSVADATPGRLAWRQNRDRILADLSAAGTAWVVQDAARFDLEFLVSEGVPTCRIVCGDEVIVQGWLS